MHGAAGSSGMAIIIKSAKVLADKDEGGARPGKTPPPPLLNSNNICDLQSTGTAASNTSHYSTRVQEGGHSIIISLYTSSSSLNRSIVSICAEVVGVEQLTLW